MIARVCLIAGLSVVTLGGVIAQEVDHSREGLRIARGQCTECHLVDKVPGRSPNAAAPTFETIANVPGMTSTALIAALRTSHKTMPNIIIKADEIDDLVAYILSLKNSE